MKKILELVGIVGSFFAGKRLFQRFNKSENPTSEKEESAWYSVFSAPSTALVFSLLLLSLLNSNYLKEYSYFFKASLVNITQTKFTGTVHPIEKVPNWVELTEVERKMTYAQIPKVKFISIPDYNTSEFRKGMVWSPTNAKQRNAYVTYPVPNLGNYRLDGTENSGSHPGIDIKAPIGTPIRAMANGIIYKTGNQKTGFGLFVSISHVGVPDPSNTSKKTTLISNYAHMSQILVKEGDLVKKGQIIGKVGNTGMATAPHVHFQIDRADAPFHPYWPFSWKDVQRAGYNSYFDGVRYGVGRSNAKKYTVHPLNFVTRFDNYRVPNNLVVSVDPEIVRKIDKPKEDPNKGTIKIIKKDVSTVKKEEKVGVIVKPIDKKAEPEPKKSAPIVKKEKIKKPVVIAKKTRAGLLDMKFETDRSFAPGKPEVVSIKINKEALIATSGIEIGSTLKKRATVTPNKLYKRDFDKNGRAQVTIETSSPYVFKLVASGDFGELKSPSLRPEIFTDVPGDHTYAKAIKDLRDKKVVKGYSDGTFKPEDTLNRVEALKIILVSNSIPIDAKVVAFPDVSSGTWFWKYVGAAVVNNIVKGYRDGTFRPSNDVTRAEFIKMAILSAGFDVDDNVTREPYRDVKTTQWYAKYFVFAKKYKLLNLSGKNAINPNVPITRGEAADVIYRLSRIR